MPSHHPFYLTSQNKGRGGRGGRKPKEEDLDLDPHDAEKKRLRRIRNKEAAARCRQRRIDLMNQLQNQVDGLENELLAKKDEIERLREQKERLEILLQNHHPCKLNGDRGLGLNFGQPSAKSRKLDLGRPSFSGIKLDPEQTLTQVVTQATNVKIEIPPPHTSAPATSLSSSNNILDRPGSLNLSSGLTPTTPSGGLLFGELMGMPTGLTPVNTTGYTPITTGALSLETPTTQMGKEVNSSLCEL